MADRRGLTARERAWLHAMPAWTDVDADTIEQKADELVAELEALEQRLSTLLLDLEENSESGYGRALVYFPLLRQRPRRRWR